MVCLGIIEDDAEIRNTLVDFFNEQPGFTCVASAGTVEAFMQTWENGMRIDIVLSDIGLPGESGIAGVSQIKKTISPMPGGDAHGV